MGKIAFLFSGQGAQYSGMGETLCQEFPAARRVYDAAGEALGLDVRRLSRESGAKELARTAVAQPLIYTLSLAAWAVITEAGIFPDAGAGFSLGECSALAAAGAMDSATGFTVIRARARAMQSAAEAKGGSMAAVIGAKPGAIEAACTQAGGYVMPVNYNCPGQTVIAGETAAVDRAAKLLAAGGVRVVKLAVNAAFHSGMMAGASAAFYETIRTLPFGKPGFPLYSNLTGDRLEETGIPAYLREQMVHPVRFQEEMAAMARDGFDTFVELGPGHTLCGFIRRGIRGARAFSVDNPASLRKCLAALGRP